LHIEISETPPEIILSQFNPAPTRTWMKSGKSKKTAVPESHSEPKESYKIKNINYLKD
jgi:hypothetical protein